MIAKCRLDLSRAQTSKMMRVSTMMWLSTPSLLSRRQAMVLSQWLSTLNRHSTWKMGKLKYTIQISGSRTHRRQLDLVFICHLRNSLDLVNVKIHSCSRELRMEKILMSFLQETYLIILTIQSLCMEVPHLYKVLTRTSLKQLPGLMLHKHGFSLMIWLWMVLQAPKSIS